MENVPPIIVFGKKISPALLAGTLLGLVAGWISGFYFSSARHALDETKLCHLNLTDKTRVVHPQTREYLKARLYNNAVYWISPSYMQGLISDFGPVDEAALEGISAIKDPTMKSDLYESAMEKHGIHIISLW